MNGTLNAGLSPISSSVSGSYVVTDRYILVRGRLISHAIFIKIVIMGNQYL